MQQATNSQTPLTTYPHTVLAKQVIGSKLYGTDINTSDVDTMAVTAPLRQLDWFGFRNVPAKHTTSEDVDCTVYTLQHFLRLVNKGSLNCLEILFTPHYSEHRVHTEPIFNRLYDNRFELLNSERLVNSLEGYLHNMVRSFDRGNLATKKATHILRLAYVGYTFVTTREFVVEIGNKATLPYVTDDLQALSKQIKHDEVAFDTLRELCKTAVRVFDSHLNDNLDNVNAFTVNRGLMADIITDSFNQYAKMRA